MIQGLRERIHSFFLSNRFFLALLVFVLLYTLAYLIPWLLSFTHVLFVAFLLFCLLEFVVLYSRHGITAERVLADKFSLGDDNLVTLRIHSEYPLSTGLNLYDELPLRWQVRDFFRSIRIKAHSTEEVSYTYRPLQRGAYQFGSLNVLCSMGFGFVQRRYRLCREQEVAVYPSYLAMNKYEYMAISNHLQNSGIKKIRRIGHNYEFEKIKDYVAGDDFRTINWKATARKGRLMVNLFQDERSQQVYCLLDKGRVMNQPFEGLTLLDHSINASLVLANIAIKKYDKAGIMTLSEDQVQVLPAERRSGHMQKIQEMLYRQETRYLESDYERLYIELKRSVPQRSLLILFTNFDTVTSMQRRLPYMKAMARNHLLLVVFFENTETMALLGRKAHNVREVYRKTIAEKFRYEKEQIVNELTKNGIMALLTSPADLTINTLNRYIQLKARGLI